MGKVHSLLIYTIKWHKRYGEIIPVNICITYRPRYVHIIVYLSKLHAASRCLHLNNFVQCIDGASYETQMQLTIILQCTPVISIFLIRKLLYISLDLNLIITYVILHHKTLHNSSVHCIHKLLAIYENNC